MKLGILIENHVLIILLVILQYKHNFRFFKILNNLTLSRTDDILGSYYTFSIILLIVKDSSLFSIICEEYLLNLHKQLFYIKLDFDLISQQLSKMNITSKFYSLF